MKKLKGKITISRPRGSGDQMATIEIIDQLSGCVAVGVEMPLQEFADALMGAGHVECDIEFNDSGVVGKKREVKRETVYIRGNRQSKDRAANVAAAFGKFEVDGWEGRRDDVENFHRRVSGSPPPGMDGEFYNVTFIRFVDPPPE
jgi:hypothetical protein